MSCRSVSSSLVHPFLIGEGRDPTSKPTPHDPLLGLLPVRHHDPSVADSCRGGGARELIEAEKAEEGEGKKGGGGDGRIGCGMQSPPSSSSSSSSSSQNQNLGGFGDSISEVKTSGRLGLTSEQIRQKVEVGIYDT